MKRESSIKLRKLALLYRRLDKASQREFLKGLDKETLETFARHWYFIARDKQLPPLGWGEDYTIWFLVSGRAFGKTRTASEALLDYIEDTGPGARAGVVGRTTSDVNKDMIHGVSGIIACANRRGMIYNYEPSKTRIVFEDGGICIFHTAEEPSKMRGPGYGFTWCDEISSWQYDIEAWDNVRFSSRESKTRTKIIVTSTPKPTKLTKKLLKDIKKIHITRGTSYENLDNLSLDYKETLLEYEGTRVGRQEIYGELLEDNPDALWQYDIIPHISVVPQMVRIVIGVDPAVTSGEDSDKTGIIVVGIDEDGRGYVLEDATCRLSPERWTKRVCRLYDKWEADRVVAEVNQGGDMVETLLRQHDASISYKSVRATKGKRTRAEPIAALYEQGKVSHVWEPQDGSHTNNNNSLAALEEQMTTYAPDNYIGSPDRVDALVWALTELMLKSRPNLRFI